MVRSLRYSVTVIAGIETRRRVHERSLAGEGGRGMKDNQNMMTTKAMTVLARLRSSICPIVLGKPDVTQANSLPDKAIQGDGDCRRASDDGAP
jgi:hypothetical protein